MGVLSKITSSRILSVLCVITAGCAGQEASPVANSSGTEVPAATAGAELAAVSGDKSVPSATASAEPAAAGGDKGAPSATPPGADDNAEPAGTTPAPATPAAEAAGPASAPGTLRGSVTTKPVSAAKSAVVYLVDAGNVNPVNATLTNKQMNFSPSIVVLSVGGKLTFTNADPFPHNIFSPDHEKFDTGLLAPSATQSKTFSKPGAYTLLCNLHPNMRAYLLVTPSSYFGKVDSNGNFTIKDVPPGTYKAVAWTPGLQTSTQTITVNGDTNFNFELHR
jgi:plastocyanin